MRVIAAINVNLDESPIGTRSRLREPLNGRPVLRHTIERASRIRGIDGVHALVPLSEADEVRSILMGVKVSIETHDAPTTPHCDLVRAGRFWGLDGWRGGVGSLCVFDEDFNAALLQGLAAKAHADAVLSIPAAAPLLDSELISQMVDHFQQNAETSRMTIMQAPPGLNGIVLARDVIDQLLPVGMPPGAMLVYQPGSPAPDLTGREACYRPDTAVVRGAGRLLFDTSKSIARIRRVLAAGGEHWNAAAICRWLAESDRRHVHALPDEIEIELTTEDQFDAQDLFHPRGRAVPQRGPIDVSAIDQIAESISNTDDTRIVLGGFGEPTLHPKFPEICRRLRQAGTGSICLRTNGVSIPGAAENAIFETPIDVVEVTLDAANAETYRRVHGIDAFAKATATIDRWCNMRNERQSVRPLLVPSLTKSFETLDDMEPFVDHWLRRLGAYVIRGASHFANQRPDLAVTSMSPPRREPCRRMFSRMMILADGSVTTCDQDFAAKQKIGTLGDASISDLWNHPQVNAIRNSQIGECALCPNCEEWHRP
ncbi:MAG: SPASM domain-containing protein [Phycisphaerales bacterium]|nr:SPASM domain-containing protein [Phycisphaerales bacterium]MCB9863126.1 SPASM domain-containing protein [Phycisphaerales bacterium]